MGTQFEPPKVEKPYRAILMGAAVDGWFKASDEERREKVLPRAKKMFAEEWPALGARAIATLDDDLFMVGPPGAPPFTWYLIYELPELDTLAAMLHMMRTTIDGVRLDRYLRIEARFGRPFFLLGGV